MLLGRFLLTQYAEKGKDTIALALYKSPFSFICIHLYIIIHYFSFGMKKHR